jgi:peptidoglycan biosynthesis protein MviN/MurJ (putative lipid II flippase)
MFFIPVWIPNVLLLLSCVLANYQQWRLNRENIFKTLQFGITIFSVVMIVSGLLYARHHRDPWLSLVFFFIALATLVITLRQFRMLPPTKAFE